MVETRRARKDPAMLKPETEVAKIGVRLIDGAYMAWLVAERECDQALRAWQEERPGAYWGYRAALDREEAAARDLERLSELASPCQEELERVGAVRRPAPAAQFAGGLRSPLRSTQP
jgi:hypothetical protein